MRRHLFLTGKSGVGKTTLLNRLLRCGPRPCGFISERAAGLGVYLHDPAGERYYTPDNRVGSWENGILRPCPEIFETIGIALLSHLPPDHQILMDELGVLEEGAPRFCARVLELLDGARPILGVVKDRRSPFLDAVRSHPGVEVILVTEENREALCSRLKKR